MKGYRNLISTLVLAAAFAGFALAPAIAETKYNFSSRPWSLAKKFHKQEVNYSSKETRGTIIISTRKRYLYYVLGNGKAIRYGIGVGRAGFKWSGVEKITRKAEWPTWRPPAEMRAREPDLPEVMPGGEDNPLGARALYLGNTLYRIHGTAQPWTIGTSVSSGCIRLTNEDVIDLYNRTKLGAKVIVN
ncbi:MAG: L,D-transpeptidase [Hyphomicrobiales bacterium]